MNITELLGEATEYDKKQAVEMKKPKSWLKSISAFANGVGGTLIFGIADDETIVGIKDTKVASDYMFEDYSFTKLRERYKEWTGNSMSEKAFESFGLLEANGKLTNAGAILADNSPVRHSRLFCTRWNGLDKSCGQIDALDSGEYSGSLITLLNEGVAFVRRNLKVLWKKTPDSRIEMPDYCERSVFESIVNALVHRDYLINGSEVHIDIFDNRLVIYSPGGE